VLGLEGDTHILELKDDPDNTSDKYGRTALRLVAELRGLQVIKMFLEHDHETLNT